MISKNVNKSWQISILPPSFSELKNTRVYFFSPFKILLKWTHSGLELGRINMIYVVGGGEVYVTQTIESLPNKYL